MDKEENKEIDQDEGAKVRNRVGEIMSRLMSEKHDAKVMIKFKTEEEIEEEKKNKK